jgi:hypothetical protein
MIRDILLSVMVLCLSVAARAVESGVGSSLPAGFVEGTREFRQLLDAELTPEQVLTERHRHRLIFAAQVPELIARLQRSRLRSRPRRMQQWWDALVPILISEAQQHLNDGQVSYEWFVPFVLRAATLFSERSLEVTEPEFHWFEGRTPLEIYDSNENFVTAVKMGVIHTHVLSLSENTIYSMAEFPHFIVLPAVTLQMSDANGVSRDQLPSVHDLIHVERLNMTVLSVVESATIFDGNHQDGQPTSDGDPISVIQHDQIHATLNSSNSKFRNPGTSLATSWIQRSLVQYRAFQDILIRQIDRLPDSERLRAEFAYFAVYREFGYDLGPVLNEVVVLPRFARFLTDRRGLSLAGEIVRRLQNPYDLGTMVEPLPNAATPSAAHQFWDQAVADLISVTGRTLACSTVWR